MNLCLALAGLVCISFFGVTESSVKKFKSQELNFTTREQLTARRQFFLGHRELSDLLTALDILSNTVDVIANPPSERTQMRFQRSLLDLNSLAKFHLGMNEVFLFPANYLLFDLNDPQRALSVLDLGLDDPHANLQMPLMAGFIAHVFLRDTQKAAAYYKALSEKPKVPPWIGDLAHKLQTGADPFVSDLRLAGKLCKLVKTIFPQSQKVIARTHPECLGGNLE